MKFFLKR